MKGPSVLWHAAHITARAFSNNPAGCISSFLGHLFSMACSGAGNIHLVAERQAVFALVPHRPGAILLRAGGFLLALCVPAFVGFLASSLWSSAAGACPAGLALSGLLLLWLAVGIAMMARRAGTAALDARSLPAGELYILNALAQIPGTNSNVLHVARRAISQLPDGSVVATAAENEQLASRYEKLGFIRGPGLQLHLVVPGV